MGTQRLHARDLEGDYRRHSGRSTYAGVEEYEEVGEEEVPVIRVGESGVRESESPGVGESKSPGVGESVSPGVVEESGRVDIGLRAVGRLNRRPFR